MTLSKHLKRVEKYGYCRGTFPLSYEGHNITILHNDAQDTYDGRIRVRFLLHCTRCGYDSRIRGRLSHDEDVKTVTIAKLATLARFKYNDCV